MVENALRLEPLAERMFAANGMNLAPVPACERISLRARPDALAGLGKTIGFELPEKPGSIASHGDISALWIGPHEWSLTAPTGTGLEEKLHGNKTGRYSVVAIDHRNTGIFVSGPKAVTLLNSGCPRDLSLSAFPVSTASRTLLAKSEIILWRVSEDHFRIECWRSFSDYVWKYLVSAARSA